MAIYRLITMGFGAMRAVKEPQALVSVGVQGTPHSLEATVEPIGTVLRDGPIVVSGVQPSDADATAPMSVAIRIPDLLMMSLSASL